MADDPLIGRQFANFRIERVLGRGGMAVVYSGTDVVLRRPVALKMIDARYRGQKVYAERFVQEARAAATWRHENIIQVYYAGEQDGLYFYVMEFIDGADLARLLDQYRRAGELAPQGDVLHIGRALASALDYAHARGVVHRDVKPSNVFIERGGRVVLGDFGLALDTALGSRGEVFGTPHYMAPEQARASNTAVAQSDLYSLGVILYEMLTGSVPFDDPSPSAVALQHLTLPVPPPSRLNPNLNHGVDAVLLKALSKEPGDRYRTGVALVDALEIALQDIPHATMPFLDLQPLAPGSQQPPGRSRVESQVSIFQRVSEAPPVPDTSPDLGSFNDRQIATPRGLKAPARPALPVNKPRLKPLMWMGIGGFAALALLCLMVLLRPGIIPGSERDALPSDQFTPGSPGVAQNAHPDTAIGAGPDPTTVSASATFAFSASKPGSTFECSLDGSSFNVCTTPRQYTGLSVGPHTFTVRAVDSLGNTDETPASYSWIVEQAAAPTSCGAAITIFAGEDSWIDQNSASNNFGTDAILKVRSQGPSDNFRALVRFALPDVPQGCVVQSATLSLYAASATSGRTLETLQISGPWEEGTVTWSSLPQTTGLAATTSSGGGNREWDVSAQVQAMYDTGANHGFLVRDANEGGNGFEQQFHSREKGENPPILVISFAPAGE